MIAFVIYVYILEISKYFNPIRVCCNDIFSDLNTCNITWITLFVLDFIYTSFKISV